MKGSGLRLVLRSAALLAAVTCLTLTPALAQAARAPIAQMSVSDAGITWSPAAAHDMLVLRVSGPEGLIVTREFAGGEFPSLSIFTEAGNALLDGSYTWELWVERQLSRGEQEAMMATRDQAGPRPERQVQSGYFTVRGGAFVDPAASEEMPMRARAAQRPSVSERGGSDVPGLGTRDQVILDDLIVDGSACVGFDCVNGESFGFDTLRLKENNLRIKFQDTSTGTFPTVDWQLTANDSSSGGANKFSIDDIDAGRTPFTIEASAPSHSLYVDDGGRVGFGTSTPVVELHVKDGDTPTLRLEQDGSSGFTPQTWDVAGNETNYFVRDVTNGSKLPFRIRPSAPTDSLYINTNGNVGMGTSSPDNLLHLASSAPFVKFEETGTSTEWIVGHGTITGTSAGGGTIDNAFVISVAGSGQTEFGVTPTGDFRALGNIYSAGTQLTVPDYVFEPDYPLMPLEDLHAFVNENKHLPQIPKAEEVRKGGLNITSMQLKLLEKVEELTLYTLQLHETNAQLKERVAELEKALEGNTAEAH